MSMIDVSALRAEFNRKLAKTDSLDSAFTKAVWVAYQAGLADAAGVNGEAEQFGYFKAEPFGWTDCAETDEGARPLYEHPTPDYAALARVAELERVQGQLVGVLEQIRAGGDQNTPRSMRLTDWQMHARAESALSLAAAKKGTQ